MSADPEFDIAFFESVVRRNAHDVRALMHLGNLYTGKGRIDDGLEVDRRLLRLRPKDPLVHYNLACSLALKRQKAAAMRALNRAVQLGYDDAEHLAEDPDLATLHALPSFIRLLNELKLRSAAGLKNGYFLS